MQLRRLSQKQRGDTIVEVLIAIGVISLVLGAAFVTTHHSLQSTRDAQERSVALKLVEGQVEQIKSLALSNASLLFGGSVINPFCVKVDAATGAVSVVAPSNVACKVDASGAPTTTEPIYSLSATQDTTTHTFTVRNQWISVGGDAQNIEMKYRVHP